MLVSIILRMQILLNYRHSNGNLVSNPFIIHQFGKEKVERSMKRIMYAIVLTKKIRIK